MLLPSSMKTAAQKDVNTLEISTICWLWLRHTKKGNFRRLKFILKKNNTHSGTLSKT